MFSRLFCSMSYCTYVLS